jgi:hypothetical protein
MLNEGNQIHNFISNSGSGTVINYGSGSTRQKVTVPTVPVPQRCTQHNVWLLAKKKSVTTDHTSAWETRFVLTKSSSSPPTSVPDPNP